MDDLHSSCLVEEGDGESSTEDDPLQFLGIMKPAVSSSSFLDFSDDGRSGGLLAADDSFLDSFECGGALLSSGHWSISCGGGDSVQWNGVKEGLYDPWGLSAPAALQIPSDAQNSGGVRGPFFAQPKSKPTPSGFLGIVKPDPEAAWSSRESSGSLDAFGILSPPFSPPFPTKSTFFVPSRTAEDGSSTTDAQGDPSPLICTGLKSEAQAAPPAQSVKARASRRQPFRAAARASSATTPAPGLKPEPQEEEDTEDHEDAGDSEEGADGEPASELSEKRRRNREHAKRSRMRKRVRLGGLEDKVLELRRQNVRLRQMVKQGIPDRAEAIIRTCAEDNTDADLVAKQDVVQGMRPGTTVGGSSSASGGGAGGGSRARSKSEGGNNGGCGAGGRHRRVPSALKLMSPSYQSVKALSASQANFILTNPNLPGCPIIFASPGFLELTGYEASQVIGKNCRVLQGPGTDPVTVSIIRNNLAQGRDTSVCILNYKADGTPFWNQLSIGNLLDAHGKVANNVGVLCEVNQMPPADFHRLLHRVPLPESLLQDSSDSGEDMPDDKTIARSRYSAAAPRSVTGSSGSRTSGPPRVVDKLRRTRALAASVAKDTA